MPTDTQFATDWLEERNRFDEAARNPQVEHAFLQAAQQYEPVNIIDLGAGSGATFLYLAPKIQGSQRWTLVELNPSLLKHARQRIQLWGHAKGMQTTLDEADQIVLQRDKQEISIQFIKGSFLKLDRLLPLQHYQLATASAVIDLLSPEMLEQLLQVLYNYELGFYTMLNYQGMQFFPEEGQDAAMIAAYEKHMQRQQDFGRALGPDCADAFRQTGQQLYGKSPVEGQSDWIIRPSDRLMHRHLLSFMEKSIPEVAPKLDLPGWLERKQQLLEQGQLRLTVAHLDQFLPYHAS